jgi:hypothetical protein
VLNPANASRKRDANSFLAQQLALASAVADAKHVASQ